MERVFAVEESIEPAGIDENRTHRIASTQARSWDFKSSTERGVYLPAKDSKSPRGAAADFCNTMTKPSLMRSERLREVRALSLLAAWYCHS
jgi:hypothetical protein